MRGKKRIKFKQYKQDRRNGPVKVIKKGKTKVVDKRALQEYYEQNRFVRNIYYEE